ncbi:MAG: thiamine-phosphate kinase [Brevinema sp.]
MPKNNQILSESQIIEELKVLFESGTGRLGIGDDAAVLERNQLVSTDAIVEGIHFIKGKASWDDVAYKLFASNASDIAAMGGYVSAYTLTLSLPEYWTSSEFRSFLSGVRTFLNDYPADLVGGDTVRSKEFFASVTVFGQAHQPWLRSQAQVGDFIYCTGTLGDSRLYLNKILGIPSLPIKNERYFHQRHYRPNPRNHWTNYLRRYPISSAMDISDGLIEDLQKLCRASKTSFCIEADALPLSEEQIGIDNIQEHRIFYQKEALIGGEDYELLFTSAEIINEELALQDGVKISRIGRILSAKDPSFIIYNKNRCLPNQFKGYEH